jgi:general stress protein YciG
MPKPVKKAAPQPAHGDPFEEQFRKRMSELGRKGGKASGAKRMDMPEKLRRDIAMRAAQARWKKKSRPDST